MIEEAIALYLGANKHLHKRITVLLFIVVCTLFNSLDIILNYQRLGHSAESLRQDLPSVADLFGDLLFIYFYGINKYIYHTAFPKPL